MVNQTIPALALRGGQAGGLAGGKFAVVTANGA
jgi:hypothetical protein